jgi:hypothetical protein
MRSARSLEPCWAIVESSFNLAGGQKWGGHISRRDKAEESLAGGSRAVDQARQVSGLVVRMDRLIHRTGFTTPETYGAFAWILQTVF